MLIHGYVRVNGCIHGAITVIAVTHSNEMCKFSLFPYICADCIWVIAPVHDFVPFTVGFAYLYALAPRNYSKRFIRKRTQIDLLIDWFGYASEYQWTTKISINIVLYSVRKLTHFFTFRIYRQLELPHSQCSDGF